MWCVVVLLVALVLVAVPVPVLSYTGMAASSSNCAWDENRDQPIGIQETKDNTTGFMTRFQIESDPYYTNYHFGQEPNGHKIVSDFNGDQLDDIYMTCSDAQCVDADHVGFIYYGSNDPPDFYELANSVSAEIRATLVMAIPNPPGATDRGANFTQVASLGDINGDQMGEIMISSPSTAEAYILFGSDVYQKESHVSFPWTKEFSFHMNSSAITSFLGRSIAGIGDVDNDGNNDVLVSDGGGSTDCAWILFGGNDQGDWEAFDVQTWYGGNPDVKRIVDGITMGHGKFGQGFADHVDAAGDTNGDGIDDFLINCEFCNSGNGSIYVVYGVTDRNVWGDTIDLSDLIQNHTGPAETGFQIIDNESSPPMTFASTVGDMNKDGYSDIAVTRHDEDGESSVIVVFGEAVRSSVDVNISLTVTNDAGAPRSFGITDAPLNNFTGLDRATAAGDLNGDGFDDMIMAGNEFVYVMWGSVNTLSYGYEPISQFAFPPLEEYGFLLVMDADGDQGYREFPLLGANVGGAGDINGDRLDDIIFGRPLRARFAVPSGPGKRQKRGAVRGQGKGEEYLLLGCGNLTTTMMIDNFTLGTQTRRCIDGAAYSAPLANRRMERDLPSLSTEHAAWRKTFPSSDQTTAHSGVILPQTPNGGSFSAYANGHTDADADTATEADTGASAASSRETRGVQEYVGPLHESFHGRDVHFANDSQCPQTCFELDNGILSVDGDFTDVYVEYSVEKDQMVKNVQDIASLVVVTLDACHVSNRSNSPAMLIVFEDDFGNTGLMYVEFPWYPSTGDSSCQFGEEFVFDMQRMKSQDGINLCNVKRMLLGYSEDAGSINCGSDFVNISSIHFAGPPLSSSSDLCVIPSPTPGPSSPSPLPTVALTFQPTPAPTHPTIAPTAAATVAPTSAITSAPTSSPTHTPFEPTPTPGYASPTSAPPAASPSPDAGQCTGTVNEWSVNSGDVVSSGAPFEQDVYTLVNPRDESELSITFEFNGFEADKSLTCYDIVDLGEFRFVTFDDMDCKKNEDEAKVTCTFSYDNSVGNDGKRRSLRDMSLGARNVEGTSTATITFFHATAGITEVNFIFDDSYPQATPTPDGYYIDKDICDNLSAKECLAALPLGQHLTNEQASLVIDILDEILSNYDSGKNGDLSDDAQEEIIQLVDNVKESLVQNLECGESITLSTQSITVEADKLDATDLSEANDVTFESSGAEFSVSGDDLDTSSGCVASSQSEIQSFPSSCSKKCDSCSDLASSLHSFTFHDSETGEDVKFKGKVQFNLPVSKDVAKEFKDATESASSSDGSDCGGSSDGSSGGSSGGNSISVPQCAFFDTDKGCFSRKGCKQIGEDYKDKNPHITCECSHLSDFAVVFGSANGGGNGAGGACGDSSSVEIFTPIFISSMVLFGVALILVILICVIYHFKRRHDSKAASMDLRSKMNAHNQSNAQASAAANSQIDNSNAEFL